MSITPRIVLIMLPAASYDRGVLRGISRYLRLRHRGPYVCFLAGEQHGVPMVTPEQLVTHPTKATRHRNGRHGRSVIDFKGLEATGIIGRLYVPRIADAVVASGLPVIAMDLTDEQLSEGSPLAGVSEIRPDSYKAGRLAAEHLLDRGFRYFAFCGYPNENWSRRRKEGFSERIQEAGLRINDFQLRQSTRLQWHRELMAVAAQLRSLPKPAGLLACNDILGRQLIEACTLNGLRVPDDIAIVGIDEDHLLSDFSNPRLSSVAFNAEGAGYKAAELLCKLMSGQVQKQQCILAEPLGVIARESTDIFAVEDREVASALVYIRDNSRQPIGARDVVKHSAISRRSLEVRFRQCLGRSIREEIQRVRLERAKELLVETNLSFQKVANHTGFGSLSYLSNVFHRVVGVTLGQYREGNRSL